MKLPELRNLETIREFARRGQAAQAAVNKEVSKHTKQSKHSTAYQLATGEAYVLPVAIVNAMDPKAPKDPKEPKAPKDPKPPRKRGSSSARRFRRQLDDGPSSPSPDASTDEPLVIKPRAGETSWDAARRAYVESEPPSAPKGPSDPKPAARPRLRVRAALRRKGNP